MTDEPCGGQRQQADGQRELGAELGPALDGILEALDATQAARDRPAGVLRVAVSRPAFAAVLQPLLADFHRAHPDIQLEFSFDDAFVDIAARGLDVGIRLGDSVAAEMVSVPVSRSEPIAIVASPAYLKRRGVPRAVGDLVRHDCIRFRMPSAGTVYRWELLDDGKPVQVDVRGPVTVNDTAALLTCAVEGLGLAYVIERTALWQLRNGTLRRVLTGSVPTLPGFHLYYASRRHVPPKLRCFVDFIAGRCATRRGAAA